MPPPPSRPTLGRTLSPRSPGSRAVTIKLPNRAERHLWARTSDDTPAGYGRVFPLGVGVLPVRVMGRLVLFNASAPTLKRAGGG